MAPNRVRMLKTTFFQKVRRIAETYDPKNLPSEELRGQMILNLRVLLHIAQQKASKADQQGGPFGKEHRKWSKLAAEISKCINVILRDYDAVKVKAQLEELKELVYNELLRGRKTRN